MVDGSGNGEESFKVKHGTDAAEVTIVQEAGAGEVGDAVVEKETRIENNTKITSEVEIVEEELLDW